MTIAAGVEEVFVGQPKSRTFPGVGLLRSTHGLQRLTLLTGLVLVAGFILVIVGLFVLFRQEVNLNSRDESKPEGKKGEHNYESGAKKQEEGKSYPGDSPAKSDAGQRQYEDYQDRETMKAYNRKMGKGGSGPVDATDKAGATASRSATSAGQAATTSASTGTTTAARSAVAPRGPKASACGCARAWVRARAPHLPRAGAGCRAAAWAARPRAR